MGVELVGPESILEIASEVTGTVLLAGTGNTVRIGRDVQCGAVIRMQGDHGLVEIGDGCTLQGGSIHIVRGEGSEIRVGAGTTIVGADIGCHEPGRITIGADCMFADQIHMDVSDLHPIFAVGTTERVNPAADIEIGDHVWLGHGVHIAKGARIGAGSVVGAGSLVIGDLPANVIAHGTPATVVREGIEWQRDFDPMASTDDAFVQP
jgi:acetyltransferase-like isoleucine patch superfamily enzyme